MDTALDDVIQELRDHANRLRGRLFQAIEATGMPEQQQVAVKGLIRRLSYDLQADMESSLRQTRGHPGGPNA